MESMTKVLEQELDIDLHLVLLWSAPIHFIVMVTVIKTIYNLTFYLIRELISWQYFISALSATYIFFKYLLT